jgi:hypothetical protein
MLDQPPPHHTAMRPKRPGCAIPELSNKETMPIKTTKMARGLIAAAVIWACAAGAMAQGTNAQIDSAAQTFLATLSKKQRQSVQYAFTDEKERARWSNFPVNFVPRGGISLKDMTPAQRSAAMKLLSTVLSQRGVEKVAQIMQGDEVLRIEEAKFVASGKKREPPPGNGAPPPGHNGPHPGNGAPPLGAKGMPPPGMNGKPPPFPGGAQQFGDNLYYIAILGTPSTTSPWMLQFGGHHLALNITVDGDKDVLTPTLTGAQPALYKIGGKTVRPLGAESDKGLALLKALDAPQQKQAVLGFELADLVLGPGQDGVTIQPEGLKASAMNGPQRALLLDVIAEWAGIVNDSAAAARMAQLKADLDQTWFAWSGPTDGKAGENIVAYYRIQGPHVVIEYAPQGGDGALHVHAMYRDPTNDYGRAPVKK